MVDNRGISPVTSSYFTSNDAQANKMSEEKYGQGDEYFAQEMQEEENQTKSFQDRSAQLRASLNGLAMANAGSMRVMKMLKEKEEKKKKRINLKQDNDTKKEGDEEFREVVFDE